jgi:thiamine pyrophosphate-dependent acetolactate synthase large subunit-like protein
MTEAQTPLKSKRCLDRRSTVAAVLEGRDKNLLVIAGLGSPCWDVASAGDDDRNFYVWGAMGGACMVALGIAGAQPAKRVLAIIGDGEMLMGLSSLATIATRRAENLAILVLDSERYSETGNQPTHTAAATDIAGVAHACGFPLAHTITTPRAKRARDPTC